MKNFDTERNRRLEGDHEFQIGGVVFTAKAAVAPEALVRWTQMNSETPESESIKIMDYTVKQFLAPGQEELWDQVRDPDVENPINVADIVELLQWLVEEQTGRPTTPPSGSSSPSGNGTSGTSLTGGSDSKADTGLQTSLSES